MGSLDERLRREPVERFALDPGKKTRTYSKGNRQKVALVAAFRSSAVALAKKLPVAEHRELAWAGHLPGLERPAELSDLLLEWLA